MKLLDLLLLSLPAIAAVPLRASADGHDDAGAPRPYFRDTELHITVTTYDDRRAVIHTNDSGLMAGTYDPIFNGDSGKEGKITSIRLATESEIQNFPLLTGDHYAVLSYGSGNVLVVQVRSDRSARPMNCGRSNAYIVRRNIACKLDLAKAKERFLDAINEEFLSPGPSMADYKARDFNVPGSGIVIHVKADGRTVWASDGSRKPLWRKDPFKAAGLKPYRFYRPIIRFVGPVQDWTGKACHATGEFFVGLAYNSSQFGCLNARTGQFIFLGQD
ncbi:MAG: hypothetical protein ABI471_08370 [Sphingomonas bacterium]